CGYIKILGGDVVEIRKKDVLKSTLFQYLMLYTILFFIFIIGNRIIYDRLIKEDILKQVHDNNYHEVINLQNVIETQLNQLQQINNSIVEGVSAVLLGLENSNANRYALLKELSIKQKENFLIEDIIFIDNRNTQALSNVYAARIENGEYIITVPEGEDIVLSKQQMSPNQVLDIFSVQNHLFVAPSTVSNNYKVIFAIDPEELQRYFALENEFDRIGLVNAVTDEVLFSVGAEEAEGEYLYFGGNGLYDVFAATTNSRLLETQKDIFRQINLTLLCFGGITLLFLGYIFRATYLPLYKLTRKISNQDLKHKNYLDIIDEVIESEQTDKVRLKYKIEAYKTAMQHYILGNIVQKEELYYNNEEQIERLFDKSIAHTFFIANVFKITTSNQILNYLTESLGADNICFRIDNTMHNQMFLIDFTTDIQEKNAVMLNLLEEVCQLFECKIAISCGSSEYNDMTSLFASVKMITPDLFSRNQVMQFDEKKKKKMNPLGYEILSKLEILFETKNFAEIRTTLGSLLQMLDQKELPEFYSKCMLTEVTTIIFKSIYKEGVSYEQYKDNYVILLELVRHGEYELTKEQIKTLLYDIVGKLENENTAIIISVESINNYVKANYHDSNFSISAFAAELAVTSAYLSYVYKKSAGINLSEYVWQVRKEKMVELLRETSMTIEEISAKVGYDNVSSLRRKLKADTGKTPSQIRKEK
ncbi:helix-turn-helix domain-containing protein, partial [Candidatus Epulonipiscium viviparus]|uniref:helix-turn-helix domain-containing protein n=1 Tax=Candidatus Epulonipiscium viviparus TaxID=420336 RepID=UPI001A9889B6